MTSACSSDLKPMTGECDGCVSPLIKDASPWADFCSQQIGETWKRVRRDRKPAESPDSSARSLGTNVQEQKCLYLEQLSAARRPISL